MSNSKADALYFEIADAMDLLDNVTADYGSEDSLGQAELALTRAREILVDQGMLRIFAEAPAMVEALRRILQWIDAGCDPSRKSLENARAILSRIDGAGDTLPDAPVPAPTGEAKPAWFLNSYTCERCGYDWRDEWDCAVDDDCPACGARHISPTESEEIHG